MSPPKLIIYTDESVKIPDEDFYYILTKNGILQRNNLGLVKSLVPVSGIPNLLEIEPQIEFDIPNLPYKILSRTVAFFRKIYQLYKSECVVILFLDRKTKTYEIYVPVQKVSSSGIDYDTNISFPGKLAIGTIHSHAKMSAFHSSIDDGDENYFDGVHITVGSIDENPLTTIVCSFVVSGYRLVKEPVSFIEGITPIVDKRHENDPEKKYWYKKQDRYPIYTSYEVPDIWLSRVSERTKINYKNGRWIKTDDGLWEFTPHKEGDPKFKYEHKDFDYEHLSSQMFDDYECGICQECDYKGLIKKLFPDKSIQQLAMENTD